MWVVAVVASAVCSGDPATCSTVAKLTAGVTPASTLGWHTKIIPLAPGVSPIMLNELNDIVVAAGRMGRGGYVVFGNDRYVTGTGSDPWVTPLLKNALSFVSSAAPPRVGCLCVRSSAATLTRQWATAGVATSHVPAIGAALVDSESGMLLAQEGGNPQFNIEVAGAANTDENTRISRQRCLRDDERRTTPRRANAGQTLLFCVWWCWCAKLALDANECRRVTAEY